MSTTIRTAVAPMLSVRRGAEAVRFYREAFGATEIFVMEAPSGAVVARLTIDEAEFWVSDESPEHQNFSPESIGGGSVRMLLLVSDPDSFHARAIAAGAKEVWPMQDEYGWRIGRVEDPFGHHWEIGRELE